MTEPTTAADRQPGPDIWLDAVVEYVRRENQAGRRPTKGEAGGSHPWIVPLLLRRGRLRNTSANPHRYELEAIDDD